MTPKKLILVTGGAGFVGSHLCERLVADGHKVISLDNYFTGSRDNHVAGVDYREGHTKDIEKLVPERPELIYHLGEYSRVHKSLEEPERVFDFNIVGTIAVLEYWRAKKCRLIYAASSTKDDATTTSADGTLGRDLTPYTWSKAANVDLIHNYARWYGLSYAITYFYSVYGPRERAWGNYGTFPETFRQNYLAGRPHEVNSPGTQTRALTHVLDTVDGIVLAAEAGEQEDYNISSDDVWTIRGVAEAFGGEIIMKPQTKVSRSAVASDSSKIKALGWKQKHHLKDYIEEAKKQKQ
jgi:UDP-glucose 4-epimerase